MGQVNVQAINSALSKAFPRDGVHAFVDLVRQELLLTVVRGDITIRRLVSFVELELANNGPLFLTGIIHSMKDEMAAEPVSTKLEGTMTYIPGPLPTMDRILADKAKMAKMAERFATLRNLAFIQKNIQTAQRITSCQTTRADAVPAHSQGA